MSQNVLVDRRLPNELAERRVTPARESVKLVDQVARPPDLDANGVWHGENHAIPSVRCQHYSGRRGLNSRQMAEDVTLGALVATRRKQIGMSQADVARLVPGLTRSALNSIEQGATKSISGDVANELVKILPVTMGELLRAMGYELPGPRGTTLPERLLSDLEKAPEEVRAAVQLLLDGWRTQQAASARLAG